MQNMAVLVLVPKVLDLCQDSSRCITTTSGDVTKSGMRLRFKRTPKAQLANGLHTLYSR